MNKRLSKLGEIAKLKIQIDTETDRGLVLSMTSFIEAQLSEILQSFLISNSSSKKLLKNISYDRNVTICHALGLINDHEQEILINIPTIRKHFAHKWEVSFDNECVANSVNKLSKDMFQFKNDDESNKKFMCMEKREVFKTVVFMLLTDLTHRAEHVSQNRITTTVWETTWGRRL